MAAMTTDAMVHAASRVDWTEVMHAVNVLDDHYIDYQQHGQRAELAETADALSDLIAVMGEFGVGRKP